MANSNREIRKVLDAFVKSESIEEKEFLESQKKSGIKLCEDLYHKRVNHTDTMRIVASMSIPGNDETSNICTKNGSIEVPRVDNSQFHIKEVKFSERKCDVNSHEHETTITTILGNKQMNIERVYETDLLGSSGCVKVTKCRSYLRPANKPSLYRTLSLTQTPGNISKEEMSTVKTADKELAPLVAKKNDAKSMFKSFMKNDLPFNSYETGKEGSLFKKKKDKKKDKKLDKKKDKKLDKVRCVSMLDTKTLSNTITIDDDGNKGCTSIKEYSTATTDMEGNGSMNTVLTMDIDTKIDISGHGELMGNIDEESEMSPVIHIDLPWYVSRYRTISANNKTCYCNEERIDLIVKILTQLIQKEDTSAIVERLNLFCSDTYHLYDCPYGLRSSDDNAWRQSQGSLYINRDDCHSADYYLNPAFDFDRIPMIDEVSGTDVIELSDKDLEYFLAEHCYKHFKTYLYEKMGSRCTPLNLARLHSVTKLIVRHIGDPSNDNDERIKRLMRFIEKYYVEFFDGHIHREHSSLVDFLVNCTCDSFEDPD